MYTITDECGRTATCTQTFTIDSTDPMITCPSNQTVSCYEDMAAIVSAQLALFNSGTGASASCENTFTVSQVSDPLADNCDGDTYNPVHMLTGE